MPHIQHSLCGEHQVGPTLKSLLAAETPHDVLHIYVHHLSAGGDEEHEAHQWATLIYPFLHAQGQTAMKVRLAST